MGAQNLKRNELQLRSVTNLQRAAVCGWIAEIDAEGRVRVDFNGNTAGPLPARSVVDIHPDALPGDGSPAAVLLEFERGNALAPIIVGLLREARITPRAAEPVARWGGAIESERLLFEARQEVVLRCGESSITLQADGRIVIKGSRLLSRATETNRIRGASVAIN